MDLHDLCVAEDVPAAWDGYDDFLASLKGLVRHARIRAAVAANQELILLYWRIGREILLRQRDRGWGAGVIGRLAADLRREFPGLRGFSARNLGYMKAFAQAWPEPAFLQQVAARMPWFHHCLLLDRVKRPEDREWYVRAAIENGWSRSVLAHQISSRLHLRQGQAVSNFGRTLPPDRSDLAQQILKDPYSLEFLGLASDARERELHRGLLERLRDFLLELGVGFAFVGSRHHLEVGGEDFYLDLLFYHLRLRCFVVVELKVGAFRPEHAGKMSFYLSAVDDLLRQAADGPTIGILLCRTRNRVVAEYALRDTHKPMGVATYQATEALPREWTRSLPPIRQLEAELGRSLGRGGNPASGPE